MKKLFVFLSVFALVTATFFSCKKDDKGDKTDDKGDKTPVNTYDGTYKGAAFLNGVEISQFTLNVTEGIITGSFSASGGVAVVTGNVYQGGNMEAVVTMSDNSKVNLNGKIADNKMSGTWTDDEGLSGTFEATKSGGSETKQYEGKYSGEVNAGQQQIGTWEFTIIDGEVAGLVETALTPNPMPMTGDVQANGTIDAEIISMDGSTYQLSATIKDNELTGSWSNLGLEGTLSGTKESSDANHNFDGAYEGQVNKNGAVIGTWNLNIAKNQAIGYYEEDGFEILVRGAVSTDGRIIFNTYKEEDYYINASATIEGNSLSGNWSNSDGESGTIVGQKK